MLTCLAAGMSYFQIPVIEFHSSIADIDVSRKTRRPVELRCCLVARFPPPNFSAIRDADNLEPVHHEGQVDRDTSRLTALAVIKAQCHVVPSGIKPGGNLKLACSKLRRRCLSR